MRKSVIVLSLASLLSGCATAGFNAPVWPTTQSADAHSITDVEAFLRANMHTYDGMTRELESGKAITEVPILLAAVAAPTAVALGASTKWAIGAAAVGGLGLGGSNYIQARDRETYVNQARDATTCLLEKFHQETVDAQAAGLATYVGAERTYAATATASDYPSATAVIANAGDTALAASDSVVSKLKLRLANLGQAPDFGAIVTNIQNMYDKAKTGVAADTSKAKLAASVTDAQLKQLTEYPARIAECTAKIQ